jgi:hypothetical protein
MRKLLAALAVILVLLAAYSAWPFVGLYGLARAVQNRDIAAINAQADFPSIRRSLIGQITQAYFRVSGRKPPDSILAGIAVSVVASIAAPIVEGLVTPENLVALLARGWPEKGAGDKPADIAGLALPVGNIWQLYRNTEYGTLWARVSVPVDRPPEKQFRLQLRLSGTNWVLSSVDLPAELQDRLAQELVKLEKR